jgi:hypothetical protein
MLVPERLHEHRVICCEVLVEYQELTHGQRVCPWVSHFFNYKNQIEPYAAPEVVAA